MLGIAELGLEEGDVVTGLVEACIDIDRDALVGSNCLWISCVEDSAPVEGDDQVVCSFVAAAAGSREVGNPVVDLSELELGVELREGCG